MKKNLFPFLLIPVLLFGITSCKKGATGATGPAGAAGPSFTGAINGHVALYDQYGDRLYASGYNLVQLTLKGGRSSVPDTSGYFLFDSVVTGNYNITAMCNGYGGTVVNNIQFINDTLYQDVRLSAIPSFNITTFSTNNMSGTPYTLLRLTFPADAKVRNCIIFASNNANVSNLPAGYLLTYIEPLPANQTMLSVQVPVSDLNSAGIFYPDEVYYAAYSYVVNDASGYEDESTGKNVYNAIGNALVDSATSP